MWSLSMKPKFVLTTKRTLISLHLWELSYGDGFVVVWSLSHQPIFREDYGLLWKVQDPWRRRAGMHSMREGIEGSVVEFMNCTPSSLPITHSHTEPSGVVGDLPSWSSAHHTTPHTLTEKPSKIQHHTSPPPPGTGISPPLLHHPQHNPVLLALQAVLRIISSFSTCYSFLFFPNQLFSTYTQRLGVSFFHSRSCYRQKAALLRSTPISRGQSAIRHPSHLGLFFSSHINSFFLPSELL